MTEKFYNNPCCSSKCFRSLNLNSVCFYRQTARPQRLFFTPYGIVHFSVFNLQCLRYVSVRYGGSRKQLNTYFPLRSYRTVVQYFVLRSLVLQSAQETNKYASFPYNTLEVADKGCFPSKHLFSMYTCTYVKATLNPFKAINTVSLK